MKYKLTSIFLAVLMVYLIFASIQCALKAAQQGGSANSVMLFSVVITFGCEFSLIHCSATTTELTLP